MTIREAFNWLAQRPQKNYTLGEYLAEREGRVIDDNRLNFTRGGRIVERLHTGAGVFSAALVMGSATVGSTPFLPGLVFAAAALGLYKVMGVAAGKLVDMGLRHNTPRL